MHNPRKIQCLERLFKLTNCLENILEYLNEEKLLTPDEASRIRRSPDGAAELHVKLEALRVSDKLLLLDYEWTILPVERIRVLLVTERSQQTFAHNHV